jgi:DNA (cytosine-5)-methyltransferase 1
LGKRTIYAADLFCGAGGTSKGLLEACEAMGFDLNLVAVNHWDIAIASHTANHPYAKHECASIDAVDPRKLVPGGRLNLLVASPECTHHSNARGGRPMNDQSRSSAWLILRWAELLYIENIIIENVREMRSWGPLGADSRPLKSKRGEFFFAFCNALKAAGYNVEHKVLNAADYGDPTTRERLFIIARRGNKKIIWPAQTHAAADKLKAMTGGLFKRKALKQWVPARDIIDWKIQGTSIFNRKKPLAEKTLQRIYAGLKKFGGPNAEPFLIVLRQHMAAQSLNEPIPTLSAGGTHMALCEPQAFLIGRGGPSGSGRPQSVEEPLNTVMTENHRAVVEPFILPHRMFDQGDPDSIERPLPVMIQTDHHGANGGQIRSVDSPMQTITTRSSAKLVEADAFLVDVNHGVKAGSDPSKEAERRAQSINEPIGTITAGGRGKGVVEPWLVQYYGNGQAQSVTAPLVALVTTESGTYALDIRLRMLRPHELAAAMSLNNYILKGKMEDQVKQIGNAVPVQLAKALCAQVIA